MSTTDTTAPSSARFERQAATIREWVTADGSSGFQAEPGRYHLNVSSACPWAHRTQIVRSLKGLEGVISLSVVDPIRDERSWAFRDVPGAEPDPVSGAGGTRPSLRLMLSTDGASLPRLLIPSLDRASMPCPEAAAASRA